MSFDFESVERFIVGTVGQPGERAFFIQARNSKRLITIALDKTQVALLADRLALVIKELRADDLSLRKEAQPQDDGPLEAPIESEFDVGAISMEWDALDSMMSIEFSDIAQVENGVDLSLRVRLSISMCDAFINRSKAVLNAGRLPCPFCALPIDPQGHLCPRANGYRR